jgi:hypothetical protein
MVPIDLVYSIHDTTEAAIQKMIDASQRMTKINNSQGEEPEIPITQLRKETLN